MEISRKTWGIVLLGIVILVVVIWWQNEHYVAGLHQFEASRYVKALAKNLDAVHKRVTENATPDLSTVALRDSLYVQIVEYCRKYNFPLDNERGLMVNGRWLWNKDRDNERENYPDRIHVPNLSTLGISNDM